MLSTRRTAVLFTLGAGLALLPATSASAAAGTYASTQKCSVIGSLGSLCIAHQGADVRGQFMANKGKDVTGSGHLFRTETILDAKNCAQATTYRGTTSTCYALQTGSGSSVWQVSYTSGGSTYYGPKTTVTVGG